MKALHLSIFVVLATLPMFGCSSPNEVPVTAKDGAAIDTTASREEAAHSAPSTGSNVPQKPAIVSKLEAARTLLGKPNQVVFETLGDYDSRDMRAPKKVFCWSGPNYPTAPESERWILKAELGPDNRAVAFSWTVFDQAYEDVLSIQEELPHTYLRDLVTVLPVTLKQARLYRKPEGDGKETYFFVVFADLNDGKEIRFTGYTTFAPGVSRINYETNAKELSIRGIDDLSGLKLTGWFIGHPTEGAMGDPLGGGDTMKYELAYKPVPIG